MALFLIGVTLAMRALAACAQDGLDTHSLSKLNALRHTCQLKFQTG